MQMTGQISAVSLAMYKLACAHNVDDSSQPVHPRSLIRVFDGRSMGGQEPNVQLCYALGTQVCLLF